MNNFKEVLNKLHLNNWKGTYQDDFYVIRIEDSNEYALVYSILDKYAINTEYPNFGKNKSNTTVEVDTYFEVSVNNIDYQIFLIANFDTDEYKCKIKEI